MPSENDEDDNYDKEEQEQELIDETLTPLDWTSMLSATFQMNHSYKINVHLAWNKKLTDRRKEGSNGKNVSRE